MRIPRRPRLPRLAAFAVAVVVVAAAGAAYVVDNARTPGPRAPSAAPNVARPAALDRIGPGAPPDPTAVARALAPLVQAPAFGGSLAGLVVDGATGRRVFARDPTDALPPASTAKLLTATAALEALGPRATLSTRVVRTGNMLFLVGGGDVTLARAARADYPRPATLADLAARTAAALPRTAPVRLRVDASAWTGPPTATGWTPAYLSEGDVSRLSALEVDEARLRPNADVRDRAPALHAGTAFAAALRATGVKVVGTVQPGVAPTSAEPVADVDSPPVAALVRRMLTTSDNDLAEAFGRLVAARAGAPTDFSGAAASILARVRALGVPTAGLRLYDASGLSRLDRVTPAALVAVLRLAAAPDHPELRPVLDGLPVAGLTGTLADRYRHGPAKAAAGDVRAKTGNLVGVNSLAGEVVDADGRLLVFAFLTDRSASPATGEAALDRLAARLASCGCG